MDVDARVRVLAALADPARLRIVDLLSAGDASPRTLCDELGMASNLLAHHLRVLEECGVVSRHRSHADRRRTYLSLHPEALDGLLPGPEPAARPVDRIVFVCTANSARSQLAAALWRQVSSIPSTSAGTHPGPVIAQGAVAAAQRHGLTLLQDRPQPLDGLLQDHDYVVTVCDAAHEELGAGAGSLTASIDLAGVVHWSVPDPVAAATSKAFDDAYTDIAARVSRLAPRLASSSAAS